MEVKTAYNWKAHKPIICEGNERLRFMKNSSQGRGCSFCGDEIGMNEGVLTLSYHCWIHLSCIDEFCATIQKFKKRKSKGAYFRKTMRGGKQIPTERGLRREIEEYAIRLLKRKKAISGDDKGWKLDKYNFGFKIKIPGRSDNHVIYQMNPYPPGDCQGIVDIQIPWSGEDIKDYQIIIPEKTIIEERK